MRPSLPVLLSVVLVPLSIAVYIAASTFTATSSPAEVSFSPVVVKLADPKGAVERFAAALRIKTVSSSEADNHVLHPEEFKRLHQHLRRSWPLVFSKLKATKVLEHSLLLKWEGSDKTKLPILCISHQDVVGVGSEDKWTYPPFSGTIADGFVWGRGALDVTNTMTALLEATSNLLASGYKPKRTIYFGFGHDEEQGGRGASKTAEVLKEAGVKLEYILDEGGTVLVEGFKGLAEMPIAIIGTAEKVTQNYEIEIHAKGGHTMTPLDSKSSATARLARMIRRMESQRPALRLAPPMTDLLRFMGQVSERKLLAFLLKRADRWPVNFMLKHLLNHLGGELSATVKSTSVVNNVATLPLGRNVVPSLAKANVNYRLLPGDDPHKVQQRLENLVNTEKHGGEVKVTPVEINREGFVAPLDCLGYKILEQTAQEVLKGPKGLLVAPYLMLGVTDSRHYAKVSSGNILRFMPFHLNNTAGDVHRVHGIDERLGVDDYVQGVKFYIRFLELASQT